MTTADIAANVARVRERIARAAQRAGRSVDDITLIAVSKTVPSPQIMAAYAAGVRDFGENYVQEALTKMACPELGLPYLNWHFIGHLQSNKVRDVVGRFTMVHSVDTLSLARQIARCAQMSGFRAGVEILLEVKLDTAGTKFGFDLDAFPNAAVEVMRMHGVQLRGLMGMAPYSADPEQARPCFRQLQTLARQLAPAAQQALSISMGMTGDFEVAIEEGATHVRIGTAIFGKRHVTSE